MGTKHRIQWRLNGVMLGDDRMNVKEILLQVSDDFEMKLEDLCFAVSTKDFDFPFSFFAFENDEFLGLLVTDEDGMEKLHLIVKSEIVYIKIMYLDDLEYIFNVEDGKKNHEIHNYE